MIFKQISQLRKYIEIRQENLYVDIGAKRVKELTKMPEVLLDLFHVLVIVNKYKPFFLKVNNVDMDSNWKKLLDMIGITEDQMQEKKTMDFIYDFVEKRGGIENVTREIELEREGGPVALGENKLRSFS